MIFIEDGQVWESFVYVPKKPIATNPDGSWNTDLISAVFAKAKAGDEKAIMQLFEQYQYLWKKEITNFVENMLGYEDAQQEAFYAFMRSLKYYDNTDAPGFTTYFMNTLHIHLVKLAGDVRDEAKNWLYSLDERDLEGNLVHDLPDKEVEIIPEFPHIKAILTPKEYQVVIAHYYLGFSMPEISKTLNNNYDYIREVDARAVNKLKVLL